MTAKRASGNSEPAITPTKRLRRKHSLFNSPVSTTSPSPERRANLLQNPAISTSGKSAAAQTPAACLPDAAKRPKLEEPSTSPQNDAAQATHAAAFPADPSRQKSPTSTSGLPAPPMPATSGIADGRIRATLR